VDPARKRRGFALLSVLWGLSILSIIAASLLTSTDLSYRMERNALRRTEREMLVEAAINRAILALVDRRTEKRWRVDGAIYDFAFAGAEIRVSIQDELGKIDLNASDGSLLQGLLRSAGLGADDAASLVDKVLDWREAGDAHRLNGAKEAAYRAAGYVYGPRNGPFQSIDELAMVMGMTPALFARLAPAITIYSGRPVIDPQTAPREALLALPTMDETSVDALLAARYDGGTLTSGGQTAPAGIIDPAISLAGRAFTIRAEIDMGGVRQRREAVIRLTDNAAQPYWVLAWR